MADTSGWITIKNLTKEILFETDKELSDYKKITHYVINGIRDLSLYHFDLVKTVKVTCDDLGIIDMPSDYVNFISLSMADGGLMWTLTRRDDLIRTTSTSEDDESLDSDIGEGVEIADGTAYMGYMTVGAKNDGYFTIDEKEQRFIVRPILTETLFLQYISSGVDSDDGNATTIPVRIKDALKAYIAYKEILYSKDTDKRLVDLYKREYREEVSKLRFLGLPTADELRDMVYRNAQRINR